jgi:hypothetical protein
MSKHQLAEGLQSLLHLFVLMQSNLKTDTIATLGNEHRNMRIYMYSTSKKSKLKVQINTKGMVFQYSKHSLVKYLLARNIPILIL